MHSNIYLKILFLTISIFISYHLLTWFLFTSQIFSPKQNTNIGDLGRMSYQVNLLHNREKKRTLNKKFIYYEELKTQQIDILTIGDSFSAGGGGGINSFYQDFLATKYNKNIINIEPMTEYSSLEIALGLFNSGYLQKIKPEAIIVESVQRLIPNRFSKELNKNVKIDNPKITSIFFKEPKQDISIISNANYKVLYYNLAYRYKEKAQKNVYKFKLNKNLFSGKNGDDILIYNDDVKHISQFSEQNIIKVNNNFNYVAQKLDTIGIKLYFMACSDKYDLYYKYIKNNTHARNQFFDLLRPLKKDYYFVDTKKILFPLLEKGEQDIYWIDDTHWSYKASEAVSSDEIFSKNLKASNIQ